jgi:hypothetical protein
VSGLESDKLQITVGKQLNLEDVQQISQMKWIKTHCVKMAGQPRQEVGGREEGRESSDGMWASR